MSNAELRRYTWLELGVHRLVVVPLVLAVLAGMLFAIADDPADSLADAALVVFAFITAGWGAMRAYASVVEEVQDRTWDFQRMSALDPRALAWGKVFGAPVLAWYIGGWCLLAYVAAGLASDALQMGSTLVFALSMAVLLHSLGVAASALAARTAAATRSRRFTSVIMLLVGVWVLPMLLAIGAASPGREFVVHWWGLHAWPLRRFAALSAFVFALWGLFAAWRAMARELREPPWWWGWPAFAAFAAFWWAGLETPSMPTPRLADVLALAAMILCVAGYLGLSLDPLTVVSWARLRRLANTPGTAWHQHLPLWLLHALLALAVALLALAATAFASGGSVRVVPKAMEWAAPAVVLAAVLMLLRDAAFVTCFTLSTRMRRPLPTAVFYLLVADLLLPAFFATIGQQGVARALFPFLGLEQGAFYPVVGMGVHLVAASAVLAWRVRGARVEA